MKYENCEMSPQLDKFCNFERPKKTKKKQRSESENGSGSVHWNHFRLGKNECMLISSSWKQYTSFIVCYTNPKEQSEHAQMSSAIHKY